MGRNQSGLRILVNGVSSSAGAWGDDGMAAYASKGPKANMSEEDLQRRILEESKDLELRAKRKEQILKAQAGGVQRKANGGTTADVEQLIEVDNLMLESLNKKLDLLHQIQ